MADAGIPSGRAVERFARRASRSRQRRADETGLEVDVGVLEFAGWHDFPTGARTHGVDRE
jgi:hypothetical protein